MVEECWPIASNTGIFILNSFELKQNLHTIDCKALILAQNSSQQHISISLGPHCKGVLPASPTMYNFYVPMHCSEFTMRSFSISCFSFESNVKFCSDAE